MTDVLAHGIRWNCNGIADNVQIQAAIDFLANNDLRGDVILSPGDFDIDSSIHIDGNYINLIGHDKWATKLTFSGTSDYAIHMQHATAATRLYSNRVSNMAIYGSSRTAGRSGIYVKGCRYLTLDNLYLRNVDYGIKMDGTATSYAVRTQVFLKDIQIERSITAGITLTGSADQLCEVFLDDCGCYHDSGSHGSYEPQHFLEANCALGHWRNLQIDGTLGTAIEAINCGSVKILDCEIEDYGLSGSADDGHAILLSSGGNNMVFNCLMKISTGDSGGLHGIHLHGETADVINNNSIIDTGKRTHDTYDGINLDDTLNSTFVGNIVRDTNATVGNRNIHGGIVEVSTSDYNIFAGNNLYRVHTIPIDITGTHSVNAGLNLIQE